VPDNDFVVVDEDFLDDEAEQALPLSDIQRFGGRTQTGEEASDGFGETQPYFALRRVVDDCLQLRLVRLFATPQIGHSAAQFIEGKETFLISRQQALDALSATCEIAPEHLLSAFGRIGLARGPQPPVEFVLYETRVFKQTHDLFPYDLIQQILTHRTIVADRPAESAPSVRPQASIIVDSASARPRGGAVEPVAAFRATHQTLHDTGRDGAPWRVLLVGLQTLFGQCKRLFADNGRHGNFDPLRARKLVIGAVARCYAAT
jgi:hypothetical protein